MLCNLSANLTNKTRISLEVARINFLKFSAFESLEALSSKATFATPLLNLLLFQTLFLHFRITFVSSIVSCNNPVVIVALSNFRLLKFLQQLLDELYMELLHLFFDFDELRAKL